MKPLAKAWWAQPSHAVTFHAFVQQSTVDNWTTWRGLCRSAKCDTFSGPRDTYAESQGRTCPACKKAAAELAAKAGEQ